MKNDKVVFGKDEGVWHFFVDTLIVSIDVLLGLDRFNYV